MNVRSEAVVVGITESVCPICLKRIRAERVAEGDRVYLVKTCPEHGHFRAIIWRGQPSYRAWAVPKIAALPPVCGTSVRRGCPFDCGLCPEHRQHSCCVLLEVTQRCNLNCPFCFAESGGRNRDPDIGEIEGWYRTLLASGGPYNIQLSGGEPTLRDDLPEIIALGRSLGYDFFQLNTNGLRLARDPSYVRSLKKAGLSCVFLQFDGTNDTIYEKLRGTELFEEKKAAIACCAEHQLGVVLVPTLVPGVNTTDIGKIIQFAVARMPVVRGVHFQPISYFGRYPKEPSDDDRITIPEVINEIERQTGGKMQISDFRPPAAENAYCSFHGNFVLMDNGELKTWVMEGQGGCCQPQAAAARAKKAQAFVAKRWVAPQSGGKIAGRAKTTECSSSINVDSLDAFIDRVEKYTLSISGMAFQDVWNIDLERLQDCFIHVVSPDNRVIPFCAYNLTDKQGKPLHRLVGELSVT
jgi:7,8-dihydro-6-hydroxymethylpterin dimethyltransferase